MGEGLSQARLFSFILFWKLPSFDWVIFEVLVMVVLSSMVRFQKFTIDTVPAEHLIIWLYQYVQTPNLNSYNMDVADKSAKL